MKPALYLWIAANPNHYYIVSVTPHLIKGILGEYFNYETTIIDNSNVPWGPIFKGRIGQRIIYTPEQFGIRLREKVLIPVIDPNDILKSIL